jgi:hypothetical protein
MQEKRFDLAWATAKQAGPVDAASLWSALERELLAGLQ